MKKIISILMIALLLVGCSNKVDNNAAKRYVDMAINTNIVRNNHNKFYFSYYLPTSVTRVDGDMLNSILKSKTFDIILTINPAMVVQSVTDKDGDRFANFRAEMSTLTDELVNLSGVIEVEDEKLEYSVYVHRYNSRNNLVSMQIGYAKLTAIVASNYTNIVLGDMFMVGKSVRVNKNLLLDDFQYREEQIQSSVDFNAIYYPTQGYLTDDFRNESDTSNPIDFLSERGITIE